MKKFLAAFVLLIVWTNQAFALPPVRGNENYQYRPQSDWLSGPDMQRDGFGLLSELPSLRPSPEEQFDAPWKVILVLVEFTDKPAPASTAYYADMLFGKHTGDDAAAPYQNQSMADFYGSMSGGLLTFEEPLVVGWLPAPRPYSYYTAYSGPDEFKGCHGLGPLMKGVSSGAQQLMDFVIEQLIAEDIDLTQYDNDGDGQLDGLFVVHAGAGGEQTSGAERFPCEKDGNGNTLLHAGDIWSHQFSVGKDLTVVTESGSQQKFYVINYLMGPAQSASPHSENGLSAMGVWAHEFGHMLHLPDLYADATKGSGFGVGCWDLMGYAITSCSTDFFGVDPGEDPNELSVWTRAKLAWSTPREVTTENICNRRVDPTQFGGETFKITPNPETPADFFLVEYRGEVGQDKDLLTDFSVENRNRVCVWHVDNAKMSGTGLPNVQPCFPDVDANACSTTHYGLALVEFDQNESLAMGANQVEAADCMGPNMEMASSDYAGLKSWKGVGRWSVNTGSLSTQGSISIIVDPNHEAVKPQFATKPRSAERGSVWAYQAKLVEDSGVPQWQLLSYPAGMTINVDTGLITWKVPLGFSKNSVDVAVGVENCGGGNEQKFTLAVHDPEVRGGCQCASNNRAPTVGEALPFIVLAWLWVRRRGLFVR